jgi:hypothetical protein
MAAQIVKWFGAISCVGILLAGCGKWPPITNNKEDILRLPVSTKTIRARFLHDEDFASLSHLPQLEDISFSGYKAGPVNFSDKGLATLVSLELPHLETLFIDHCTSVTDSSLIIISRLKTVTFLGLVACPRITDTGLRTLATMPNLTELDLRGCINITDKGLEYLAVKSNWQRIEFGGCSQVTFEAVTNLQRHFPNAKIKKDEKEWSYTTSSK